MWRPPVRNFDNIQYESYRRVVDGKFNDLADELSDCYYNYWKQGLSKKFQAGKKVGDLEYDVQPTLEESKAQFDKLHGLIWHLHSKALEDYHNSLSKEDKDKKFDSKITTEKGILGNKKRDEFISNMKQEGVEITR